MQDKANLERQLKQLNSRSSMLEKNLEKKDMQVGRGLYAFSHCGAGDTHLLTAFHDWHRLMHGALDVLVGKSCKFCGFCRLRRGVRASW